MSFFTIHDLTPFHNNLLEITIESFQWKDRYDLMCFVYFVNHPKRRLRQAIEHTITTGQKNEELRISGITKAPPTSSNHSDFMFCMLLRWTQNLGN